MTIGPAPMIRMVRKSVLFGTAVARGGLIFRRWDADRDLADRVARYAELGAVVELERDLVVGALEQDACAHGAERRRHGDVVADVGRQIVEARFLLGRFRGGSRLVMRRVGAETRARAEQKGESKTEGFHSHAAAAARASMSSMKRSKSPATSCGPGLASG